jgi:hypothetical protein
VLAIVDVVLPAKGQSRERWLTPSEAAIAEDCARGITPSPQGRLPPALPLSGQRKTPPGCDGVFLARRLGGEGRRDPILIFEPRFRS